MPLVQNDHVVQTLAANGADDPFNERTLPRRTGRRQNLVDADSCDTPAEVRTIDSISGIRPASRGNKNGVTSG